MALDLEAMSKKLDDFLNSEEGEKSILDWHDKIEARERALNNRIERFHAENYDFDLVVKKITEKYNSEKYCNHWLRQSIEPPEPLYWFLYYYAEKYGEALTINSPKEWLDKLNMFTSAAYKIHNYIIHRMDGQGSVIQIEKL